MYPILWEGFGFIVPAWHFFYFLAAIYAYWMLFVMQRWYYPSLGAQHLSRIYLLAYFFGYFGSRLFSIVVETRQGLGLVEILLQLFSLGSMTFYGGFLMAILVVYFYCRWSKISTLQVLDMCAPIALMALAIGRIGCFLNGDDFGQAVDLQGGSIPWWSVSFPNHEYPVPRYPVQLMETASAVIAVLFAIFVLRKILVARGEGSTGLFCLQSYAVIRFFIEFLRDDYRGPSIFWFSVSQVISLVVLVSSVWIAAQLKRRSSMSYKAG